MDQQPPIQEVQKNEFKEIVFSEPMNLQRYTEFLEQYPDPTENDIKSKELATQIMRGENPKMDGYGDFLLMWFFLENKDIQKRTHATSQERISGIIDPSNPSNGLAILSDHLDSTSTLVNKRSPWDAFTSHKHSEFVIVLGIDRKLINRMDGEVPSIVNARIEYLTDNLPKVNLYGKNYPKLPIQTIQGVLVGSQDTESRYMIFNAARLNPNYDPTELINIVREENPNYDPKSITKPSGPTGMLWSR